MRVRFWVIIAAAMLLIGVASCGSGAGRAPANTPVPTKTLRPTFTATIAEPTLTPSPMPEPTQPPELVKPTETPETPEAPTAEPSPTAGAAAFTVTSASLNVRSGPSTAFPVIGRLTNGQSFPISGKNNDGSWWEFDYDGRTGWVIGTNVSVRSGDAVEVAQNIPAAPTAAPRPTARPAAPRPAQPQPQPQPQPVAATRFGVSKSEQRIDTNNWVTFYCLKVNAGYTALYPGTVRVSRDGAVVAEKDFTLQNAMAYSGYSNQFPYNDGCKVEMQPAVNGSYSAVLLENGQPISDVFNFTVSGEGNRIAIVEWKEK